MKLSLKFSNQHFSLLPWLIPGAFVFTWFFLSETNLVPSYLLPHPAKIIKMGYAYIFLEPGELSYAGRFFDDATSSFTRVILGFACAAILGIPLGILSGRICAVNQLFSTFINGIRAIPGITWLPLAMVWFGIGMQTTIFLITLAAFFPIYLNASQGARQIDPHLLEAGAMMGVGKFRGYISIILPGSMPHIITGLRLGLGISWAYLVLGELTGVPNGLGAVIMDARMLGQVDMIIVGMIFIAIVGKLSDALLVSSLKMCLKSVRRIS